MQKDFHYRHLPALFTACAQCWGTVYPLIGGTRNVLLHYGFPTRIADVPETWPVWNAGNARTASLGILMFIFYARGQYDVLDTFLVLTGYLGVVDFILLWNVGLRSQGLGRFVGSGIFAAMGYLGVTQGPAS